jgi:segregation and condensation protein A
MNTDQLTNETPLTYNVDLPDFQGPLDLLLNLIEQEELDITKISLAYVTDQYLAYLDILREIDPDELADFLVVAAKLVLIKSEALLPRPPASMLDEEEEDVGDELARQLLAYKQYKKIAARLQEAEATGRRNFVRLAPPIKIEPRLVPGEISLEALLQAARNALAIRPPDPVVDEVIAPQIVTIGQQMAHIRQELITNRTVNFQGLLARSRSRIEVIVTLLAVLELIKRQVIWVEQTELFGEILIRRNERAPDLSESEWAELTGLIEVS